MMPDHENDAQLEAALESLARPAPPADHVARVLASSGPAFRERARQSPMRSALRRPRWVLPIAATALLVTGSAWQASRIAHVPLPSGPADGNGQGRWGARHDIDRPVLPPEMYWAMDPFAEFTTLQSRTRPRPTRGIPSWSTRHGVVEVHRRADVAASAERPAVGPADDEHTWAAPTDDLPIIEFASIVPAPVAVVPLPRPPGIVLSEIAMAPIPLTPIDMSAFPEQETP